MFQLSVTINCATRSLNASISTLWMKTNWRQIWQDTGKKISWFSCAKMPTTTVHLTKNFTPSYLVSRRKALGLFGRTSTWCFKIMMARDFWWTAHHILKISKLSQFYGKFSTLPLDEERTIISLFRFYLGFGMFYKEVNQLELNRILAKEKAQEEKQKHQQLHSWKKK